MTVSDPRAVLTRLAPEPDRTIAYGPDPAQVYDVRLPRGGAQDVTVVVLHGGFWQQEFDRTHVASPADALAADGFHVAVVEYRRVGMPGGGWPGTGRDVAAAIAEIRADASMPPRCVLLGHSAGGHLAAWAAGQPWALGLRGAIALAGCVDLALTHRLGLGDGAALSLIGQPPEVDPDAWAAADPARGTPAVPVVLLHGADDQVVPAQVSASYADAVARDGRPHAQVRLTVIPDCEHFGLIDPEQPAFEVVRSALSALR